MSQVTIAGLTDLARRQIGRIAAIDPLPYLPRRPRPAGTPPAVGLVGYYGWGNYGDELFLEVFREHLSPALKLLSVVSPEPRSIGRRLGSAVRDADALLIGGGDIVIPWSGNNAYWRRSYLRRPVFVAGVGVPTWGKGTPWVVDRLRLFFQHPSVRFIGTRDLQSSQWIAEHLAPSVPVVTAPDLVCGLTLPAVTRPADPPIFGVAVRQRRTPDDLSRVRQLCLRAIELGYRVRRIVLATGRVMERDLVATEALDLPDTELVATNDLATITRSIGECTAIASMKFHGVVVATMYGIPAIVMMPTAKNLHFIRDIGRPELRSGFNHPELAEYLTRDMQPISVEVRDRLRHDVTAHLADLRRRIETESREARRP
jgi:polysaccharide pyruvyl transferase WcaK-like protein